jgi:hypothetical protein
MAMKETDKTISTGNSYGTNNKSAKASMEKFG